jgi:hypothetical protein
LIAAGVSLAVSALVAVTGVSAQSPQQYARDVYAVRGDIAPTGKCPYSPEQWNSAPTEPCRWRKGGRFVVALVGDSHAMQWEPALDVVAARHNLTVIRVTRGGCPANTINQVQLHPSGGRQRYACSGWRKQIYKRLIKQYDPDLIYVETRSHVWAIRSQNRTVLPFHPGHLKLWSDGWGPTLRALTAGKGRVVVAEITPTLPFHVPACLAAHPRGTRACDARLSATRDELPYNRVIAGLPRRFPGVSVVDPTPIICPGGLCPAFLDGQVVHRDDNHVSATFSRTVADRWEAMLARAGVSFG